MRTIHKIGLGLGAVVLSACLKYGSCGQPYTVVEEEGRIYVQDRNTGKRSAVTDTFTEAPEGSKNTEVREDTRELVDKVFDAYDMLTR